MPDGPQIELLSYKRRQSFFYFLVIVFLVSLPALIFYTTGYRLDFDNKEKTIVTTGGMYVTTDNLEVEVFLDDEKVDRPRLFRSAYYIQNISAGIHTVVVQGEGLHTWVKEIPIDPYLVVEVSAFNLPVTPQVRPITRYLTATGTPVYRGLATTTDLFAGVSSTIPVLFTKTQTTAGLQTNQEYSYVQSLFSTTSTSTRSVFEKMIDDVSKQFSFSTSSVATSTPTTTEQKWIDAGNMRLLESDGELFARWLGSANSIPYYFCITNTGSSSVVKRYGEHVAVAVEHYRLSTSTPLIVDGNRLCRPEIRIDRMWQDVYFYDFFPGSNDLVLIQLQDGLYVTEIDDRAWQNTQLLYPGDNFQVQIENGVIYIKKEDFYFEVVTELDTP
jgi:hypothetical protein